MHPCSTCIAASVTHRINLSHSVNLACALWRLVHELARHDAIPISGYSTSIHPRHGVLLGCRFESITQTQLIRFVPSGDSSMRWAVSKGNTSPEMALRSM